MGALILRLDRESIYFLFTDFTSTSIVVGTMAANVLPPAETTEKWGRLGRLGRNGEYSPDALAFATIILKEGEQKVRGKTKFEFEFQNEASPSECPDFKTAKKMAFEIEKAQE